MPFLFAREELLNLPDSDYEDLRGIEAVFPKTEIQNCIIHQICVLR